MFLTTGCHEYRVPSCITRSRSLGNLYVKEITTPSYHIGLRCGFVFRDTGTYEKVVFVFNLGSGFNRVENPAVRICAS